MEKVVTNPYDKGKQETLYLAFEHGFNSNLEEDSPYAEMPEMVEANTAWLKGFKANKKRPKTTKPVEVDLKVAVNNNIDTMTDNELINELKKRKAAELQNLIKEYNNLFKRIESLKAIMEL